MIYTINPTTGIKTKLWSVFKDGIEIIRSLSLKKANIITEELNNALQSNIQRELLQQSNESSSSEESDRIGTPDDELRNRDSFRQLDKILEAAAEAHKRGKEAGRRADEHQGRADEHQRRADESEAKTDDILHQLSTLSQHRLRFAEEKVISLSTSVPTNERRLEQETVEVKAVRTK